MMGNASTAGDTTMRFGPLLRRHRKAGGMTQRVLADLSTVSVRAIRDLERGRARPRRDTVRLLTDALRLGRAAIDDLAAAAGDGGPAATGGFEPHLAAPPTVLAPLFGRECELAVMTRELTGDRRLLTVHGLPGVGRTRLAAAVATDLHRDGSPVLWVSAPDTRVPLDPPTRGPRLAAMVQTITESLFGLPTAPPALPDFTGDRDVLLVIDGVGRSLPCPEVLLGLLGDHPGLRVLVTADDPVGLPGERPFLLAPLGEPIDTGDARLDGPAARLFAHHAAAAGRPITDTDAELVSEVCALAGGLPLAVAAAASWSAVYDLRTLRDLLRLDPGSLLGPDFMSRVDARLAVLNPAERVALARLSGPARSLDEIASGTGRSLVDAGALVRGLLRRGLLGPRHESGQARFVVPTLVGSLL